MSEKQRTRRARSSRRGLVVALGSVGVIALVAGLAVFQPWKLFVDEVVDEALPVAASEPASGGPDARPSGSGPAPAASGPSPSGSATPRVIARGELISHEHATSGSVVVLELADGRRILRLQDLRTSNGPDVKVWLSDAAVLPGSDGWRVFDDGAYADLGRLKGNVGNQNYAVPASVDLGALTSLSLWCDRFDVSFGAAELRPV